MPSDEDDFDRLTASVQDIAARYFAARAAIDDDIQRSSFDENVANRTREYQSRLLETFLELDADRTSFEAICEELDTARRSLDQLVRDRTAAGWTRRRFDRSISRSQARQRVFAVRDLEKELLVRAEHFGASRAQFVQLVLSTILVESAMTAQQDIWGSPLEEVVEFRDGASLSSKAEEREFLYTDARRDIELALSRRGGASIGLAGSRGAGKTELVRHFAVNRQDRVGVLTWAPASGDPEMFMRWLLRRLCGQVLAVRPDANADPNLGSHKARTRQRLLSLRSQAHWLLPTLAIVVGIVLLASTHVGIWDRSVIGIVLSIAGSLWLLSLAVRAGIRALPGRERLGIWSLRLVSPQSLAGRFGFSVETHDDPIRREVEGARDRLGQWPRFLPDGGGGDLEPADDRLRESRDDSEVSEMLERWSKGPEAIARDILTRIEYVESLETGAEVTASLSALGGSLSQSRGLEAQQLTTLDLIQETSLLVESIRAHGRKVIIAVDELDKLPSEEDALTFLNEIKVLFPIEGCSFLVSVSDRAWIRYARRGMPIRDAFDSSFDEVVRIAPLSLKQVRELLARRVGTITLLQAGIIYALSGGLPRDVLRCARQLARAADSTQSRSDERSLAAAAERLLEGDALEKVVAAEMRLADDLSRHDVSEELMSIRTLRMTWSDSSGLPSVLEYEAVQASGRTTTDIDLTQEHRAEAAAISRVVRETRAYVALLYTLRELFGQQVLPEEARARRDLFVSNGREKPAIARGLDLLAEARRELTSDPVHSADLVGEGRGVLGLSTLSRDRGGCSDPSAVDDTPASPTRPAGGRNRWWHVVRLLRMEHSREMSEGGRGTRNRPK